jgi:hypothetical protein
LRSDSENCVAEIKTQFPDAVIDLASYEPETDAHFENIHQVFRHEQKPPKNFLGQA